MGFLDAQPLRRQIVATTCALLLLVAGALLWSAARTRAEREAEVRQEASSVARLGAAYLHQYFDGLDAMASTLARHPAVLSFDELECNRLFAALVAEQPLLLNVVLRDRGGRLRGSATGSPGMRADAPSPPFLLDVMATGRPGVGELTTAPLTGRPTLAQAYPVYAADGAVAGAISFGLNLLQLRQVFDDLALPDGSVVTLLNGEGSILARSLDGERYIGQRSGTGAPSAGGADTRPQVDVDGVERFIGTVPVDRGNWSLRVGIPRTVVGERLAPTWRRHLAIGFSAALVVFGLSFWLSNRTSSGLSRLRSAVQRIAAGDLSPPVRQTAPSLEIAELQDAFITMAANLRAARDALDRQVDQERKMGEVLQSLQRQVVRQERLAAVGMLVSGVAHELNNPLQAIMGTAELLEHRPDLAGDLREEIGMLKTQGARAREIIRSLARFSSPQSGPPTLVDLRATIAEVVQLRRHDLEKASIALDVEASGTGKVVANATELEQVTLNFVINAQQAIEASGKDRGRILIRLADDGRKVRLEVQDDGPGVPPEDEPKLFQPFFTTKPVGKGTGLGLSVSYGIIDSYGGAIGSYANEWHGATFFFELPVAGAVAGVDAETAGARRLP